MRTTIDIPDPLFRRTKAAAALRGTTMKTLIVEALEGHLNGANEHPKKKGRAGSPPYLHLRSGRKLDLTNFDFDDLLP